jgi:hypothetical protein
MSAFIDLVSFFLMNKNKGIPPMGRVRGDMNVVLGGMI